MEEASSSNDTDDDDDNSGYHCTFAVTGSDRPAFQAIFVCRSCCESAGISLACICQACAEVCHADHNIVDYIGMGPATCDCCQIIAATVQNDKNNNNGVRCGGCHLLEQSQSKLAEYNGNFNSELVPNASESDGGNGKSTPPLFPAPLCDNEGQASLDYYQEVFSVPVLLEDDALNEQLVAEAMELVRHSKETFWLEVSSSIPNTAPTASEFSLSNSQQTPCHLEYLAWHVYQSHLENGRIGGGNDDVLGLEWWVQVKPISGGVTGGDENHDYSDTVAATASPINTGAVDLHYDKDEDLAELFGLGSFPYLSTVTYLIADEALSSPPTVVFPRRYDEPNDDEQRISEVLISHPSRGKHLAFDGRLLHGAPAHPALRQLSTTNHESNRVGEYNRTRITFLVNIWMKGQILGDMRPLGLEELPEDTRCQLKQLSQAPSCDILQNYPTGLVPKNIPVVAFDTSGTPSMERIRLPFLSKDATWGNDDSLDDASKTEEESNEASREGETCVMMFAPHPSYNRDTFVLKYSEEDEAYIWNN